MIGKNKGIDNQVVCKSEDGGDFACQSDGVKLSDEEEESIRQGIIVDSILRYATTEKTMLKAQDKICPADGSNIIHWEGDFDKDGIITADQTIIISIPETEERYFKLVHTYRDESLKPTDYDKKTGFQAVAFKEVDVEGREIDNKIKIIFPGASVPQDTASVLWSILGGMHWQVPMAAPFMDELLEKEDVKGKKLEIFGNSLGAQPAIYATAIAIQRGYADTETMLVDAFSPGLAFAEVSKQLANFKNRHNNDGENAKYTSPLEESWELEKHITTINVCPPTIATDFGKLIPWLGERIASPEYVAPVGRNLKIAMENPEILQYFDNIRDYSPLTHYLTGLANLLIEDKDNFSILEETKIDNSHLVNGHAQTAVRSAQLYFQSVVIGLAMIADLGTGLLATPEGTRITPPKLSFTERVEDSKQQNSEHEL